MLFNICFYKLQGRKGQNGGHHERLMIVLLFIFNIQYSSIYSKYL